MKICLCADSHGRSSLLWEMVCVEKPDAVYFLGDGLRDLDEIEGVPAAAVGGNCDMFYETDERVFFLENKKILLTHGHRFGVKQGLLRLALYARQNGIDAVFYGHIHRQKRDEDDGRLFVCPGAIKDGKYAVLSAENGKIEVSFRSL